MYFSSISSIVICNRYLVIELNRS